MKNKVLSILLMAVTLLFAMTGCKKGGKKSKKVVIIGESITVPAQQEAWNEVIADFTAKTGIEVEQRRQGKWDEIPQRLQAAKLAKEQIDLCVVGIGTVRSTLGPSGSVMDLTDLMKDLEDRFPEGILDSCRIGGHLWAIPYYDGSGTSCFYNKTMFTELGITPPTTLNELKKISNIIKEKKGITPLAFHGKNAWAWPMLFFDVYAQSSGNKSVKNVESFLEGKTQFTGDAEKNAFDKLKEIYDAGIMTKDVFDTNEDGMIAVFSQKKAAMLFCGTWDYPTLKSMDLDFEVAGFEFPQVFDGAKPEHSFAVGDGAIEIPSFANPENLDNTMQFVEFLLRPENARKILTAGQSPIFEIVKGASVEGDAVTNFLNEKLVPNSCMYLDWIWPAEVNDTVSQVIPAVMTGRINSSEAVTKIQKSYETVREEKSYVYNWWDVWTDADWAKVQPKRIPDVKSFEKAY
jgi:raffinose/stachyose/melibiose transport system substrate-binding protein